MGRSVEVKESKKGVILHAKGGKHLCFQMESENQTGGIVPSTDSELQESTRPVELNTIHQNDIRQQDRDFTQLDSLNALPGDFFDAFQHDEDGDLVTSSDDRIQFSAGIKKGNNSRDIHYAIQNLQDFCAQNTTFGDQIKSADNFFKYLGWNMHMVDDAEDTSIPSVTAAFENIINDKDKPEMYNLVDQDEGDRFYPYPSLTMFLIDLLDSLPHLRLSDDQMKLLLWVMKLCDTPNVPSFYALQKLQSQLTKEVNIHTVSHISPLENKFFANGPAELFYLDWVNPLVCPYIRPFVEVSNMTSKFYQADRLKNEDIDLLQLMWADFKHSLGRHYYIKELAMLMTGEFMIFMK
ncbi:hypothetical protein C8Q75DRAFT_737804 [Abortiporus biennis]|nr:hypothetical protein C8Q75DRAFT_737804 [Abortiporus biennis]